MKRLFIISNRLPVKVRKGKKCLELIATDGGLATGLNSLTTDLEKHWIGWPGIFPSASAEKTKVRRLLQKQNIHPVYLTRKDIREYYEGFSNETLWPLFHYFNIYANYDEKYWETYKKVNQLFAKKAKEICRAGDIIWIQDYHLMLLPGLLREILPDNEIGYFLHIPFPSYELFRTLPWRKEILEGLMGADLIGFHTYEYMRHFTSSAYRILGYESKLGEIHTGSRNVKVDTFPMGINFQKYHDGINLPEVQSHLKQFRKQLGNVKVVVSVDRLDYSKGILQRLKAFERLLSQYPQYREKIILNMIVAPSRNGVEKYQSLKEEIDEAVGNINGKYSTINWSPIHYFYRSMNFQQLNALYNIADICLITPLRDGMNLVAKEYVASKHKLKGVLILSEMAGSAIELEGAVRINPNNSADIVKALETAINMPEEEQKQRLLFMQQRIKNQTVQKWAADFIAALENKSAELEKNLLPSDKIKDLSLQYSESVERLLILDYDGTLVPFSDDPSLAAPDEELLELIHKISLESTVVIISGRDYYSIDKWFGKLGIELVAEHGTWYKNKGHWELVRDISEGWKEDINSILKRFTEKTPGSFIEEKAHSLAWHYRKADAWLAEMRTPQLINILSPVCSKQNLELLDGNKVIEITVSGINKGTAALSWITRKNWDFIMAMGDDQTDENIFKILPENAFSLKVGGHPTYASHSLKSWRDARSLLNALLAAEKKPKAGNFKQMENGDIPLIL